MAKKSKADETLTPAVAQVFLWLVEGQRDADIVEAVADPAHGDLFGKKADARKLISEARAAIEKVATEAPTKNWCIVALMEIHRRALETGELATSLRVIKLLLEADPTADPEDW